MEKTIALIEETARRTLRIEAETITALQPSIDADFLATTQALYQSSGRLVVTGIGKSALVGQKMVATFNSTGTPALFMHAADAIHGDLGMVREEDWVLCISKSGETPEIKVLVPMVQHLAAGLIGMTARRDSFLGQSAHYVLHTPISREADPNNLAPTASTIAQAAMGDALATALLALRGFSPKDFAQYHPGGALGKQLYLRVADVCTRNELPAVDPTDNLRTTIMEMTSKRLGATAVVDSQGQLLGIITDGDLRRMLNSNTDVSQLTARDIMTAAPKSTTLDTLAVKALDQLREYSISQLPVVEGTRYVGMLHLHDLLREGLV